MTALNASYDFENASSPALHRERSKAAEREASLLLLNVTGPRAGDRVEKILSGLSAYHRDIFSDKRPFQKTEVALVVFGGWGQVLKDFVVAPHWILPPPEEKEANLSLHQAILGSAQLREKSSRLELFSGLDLGRPWVFVITNGEAADHQSTCWEHAKKLLHQGQAYEVPMLIGIRF
jgi:uncharacterized protein YegL